MTKNTTLPAILLLSWRCTGREIAAESITCPDFQRDSKVRLKIRGFEGGVKKFEDCVEADPDALDGCRS